MRFQHFLALKRNVHEESLQSNLDSSLEMRCANDPRSSEIARSMNHSAATTGHITTDTIRSTSTIGPKLLPRFKGHGTVAAGTSCSR